MIVIRTYSTLADAEIARSKLESFGITSWVDDKNISSLNMFYINAIGGIRLRVEEKDVEKAKEILGEPNNKEAYGPTKSKLKSKRIWLIIIAFILGIIFFSFI